MAQTIKDDDGISNSSGNPHLTQIVEAAIARSPPWISSMMPWRNCGES